MHLVADIRWRQFDGQSECLSLSEYERSFAAQSTGASSLLFLLRLSAFDPRDFAAEDMAKVHGGFVDRQLVNRCPEFQLMAVTVTLVAGLSSGIQVH